MVCILAFPSHFTTEKGMHLVMGMGGKRQGIGKITEQIEKFSPIFVPELTAFPDGDVKAHDDQVVPGHQLEIVFQKFQLISSESTPVTFAIAGIGVVNIIENDVVYFSIVERVIGWSEDRFKGLVGQFVSGGVVIYIVIALNVVPWQPDSGNGMEVGVKQGQIIAYEITEADTEFVPIRADEFGYDGFVEMAHFFQGIGLWIAKNQYGILLRLFL